MFVEIKAAEGVVIQADTTRVHKEDLTQSFWINLNNICEMHFRKAKSKEAGKEIGLITMTFNHKRNAKSLFYKPSTLPLFQDLMDEITEHYLIQK